MFPNVMLQFDVGRKQSILAVEKAMSSGQLIFLATQKDIKDDNPKKDEIYSFGILAKIKQILKQTDNMARVLIESVCRAEAQFYDDSEDFIQAKIEEKQDKPYDESSLESEAISITKLPSASVTVPFFVPLSMIVAPITGSPLLSFTVPFTVRFFP